MYGLNSWFLRINKWLFKFGFWKFSCLLKFKFISVGLLSSEYISRSPRDRSPPVFVCVCISGPWVPVWCAWYHGAVFWPSVAWRTAAVPPTLIESDTSSRFSVITAFVFLCHHCEERQTMLRSTCVTMDSCQWKEIKQHTSSDYWCLHRSSSLLLLLLLRVKNLSKNANDFNSNSLCIELKHYW